MNQFSPGKYSSEFQIAAVRAGWVVWLVAFGWIAMPFSIASLLHPGDVINLQYVLQGEPKHKFLTTQQMGVGFVETLFALGVLLLLQLVGTVLFYRRARINGASVATPALWPVAAIVPGVLGNAAFFVFTQEFDLVGLVIGLAPIAITYFAERLCEQLGRDFVLGPATGAHTPLYSGAGESWAAKPAGPVFYDIPEGA